MLCFLGSPVIVNGDEFQNIELQRVLDVNQSSGGLLGHQHNSRVHHMADSSILSSPGVSISSAGDMLREMVKSKETMVSQRGNYLRSDIGRYESVDSEVSDTSKLVSTYIFMIRPLRDVNNSL